MKYLKEILILLFICFGISVITVSYSQSFRREKIDSVPKTKEQIYKDTIMFIAEMWNSAQSVIQNDDKESGIILIKGETIRDMFYFTHTYVYEYGYTIIFRMKDNKYKITIDKVICEDAYTKDRMYNCRKIDLFEGDNFPKINKWTYIGLPKSKMIILVDNVRKDLESIIDSYDTYIKSDKNSNDW